MIDDWKINKQTKPKQSVTPAQNPTHFYLAQSQKAPLIAVQFMSKSSGGGWSGDEVEFRLQWLVG